MNRPASPAVEPTVDAQDAYVERFNEVALDLSLILDECTPSYFTNEGEKDAKWFCSAAGALPGITSRRC